MERKAKASSGMCSVFSITFNCLLAPKVYLTTSGNSGQLCLKQRCRLQFKLCANPGKKGEEKIATRIYEDMHANNVSFRLMITLATAIPWLYTLKVIPKFRIAHSYCARFLRHQRAYMSARAYKT